MFTILAPKFGLLKGDLYRYHVSRISFSYLQAIVVMIDSDGSPIKSHSLACNWIVDDKVDQ